ncbi:thyroglobulin type-1 repeat-containing domain protein [Cooperia oncophora]
MIQCDGAGCFCVSANTGLTAFDTRTSNNRTQPRCSGYYEMIQCDGAGCFCVSANTGLTAFDTRTSNNRTQPRCSDCQNALKTQFAGGAVSPGTFVARCDVVLGDYEVFQCDARRQYCYCVDTKTGREVQNTRKRTGENQYIVLWKIK